MQLFYNSRIDKDTKEISFDKIESKHIVKVLRKKEGDQIFIMNGREELFVCEIITRLFVSILCLLIAIAKFFCERKFIHF